MPPLSVDAIIERLSARYEGLVVARNWGECGLFYNPGGVLPKGVYFLTFKEKDGPNDAASNVNRPGVFRLNLGISKATFVRLFGHIPERPAAGGVVRTGHDFQALDCIMPHPVYGWMAWIGVLNPGPETFEAMTPLFDEGYRLAVERFKKRRK